MKMLETKDHGWIDVERHPSSAAPPARRLGTGKESRDHKPMPIPTESELRTGAHARCVDHVRVDGLTRKVCILRGDDPEAVIADARHLARVE